MSEKPKTALEALQEISRDGAPWMWARPVSWRGLGQGICYHAAHGWQRVPSSRGGEAAYIPHPLDLFGEWEVVDPGDVNQERSR